MGPRNRSTRTQYFPWGPDDTRRPRRLTSPLLTNANSYTRPQYGKICLQENTIFFFSSKRWVSEGLRPVIFWFLFQESLFFLSYTDVIQGVLFSFQFYTKQGETEFPPAYFFKRKITFTRTIKPVSIMSLISLPPEKEIYWNKVKKISKKNHITSFSLSWHFLLH